MYASKRMRWSWVPIYVGAVREQVGAVPGGRDPPTCDPRCGVAESGVHLARNSGSPALRPTPSSARLPGISGRARQEPQLLASRLPG